MKYLAAFLQIGELFEGRFNWRGLFHLILFVLMGLLLVVSVGFIGYKAFQSERKKKDDV